MRDKVLIVVGIIAITLGFVGIAIWIILMPHTSFMPWILLVVSAMLPAFGASLVGWALKSQKWIVAAMILSTLFPVIMLFPLTLLKRI